MIECNHCGVSKELNLVVDHLHGGVVFQLIREHNAPCGRPCFGGGARGKEKIALWKSGDFHQAGKCKTCFPLVTDDPISTPVV